MSHLLNDLLNKLASRNKIDGFLEGGGCSDGRSLVINCLNPHSLMVALENDEFKSALTSSTYLVADGVGILYASKLMRKKNVERITGYDLYLSILNSVNDKNGTVFLMGSSNRVLRNMKEKMMREFPRIERIELYSPSYCDELSESENNLIRHNINSISPDALFVAMTAPKQEIWLDKNKKFLEFRVAACVGAVFDYYGGEVKPPPTIVRKMGFEWIYRLLVQPRRLWRRTFVSMPKFIFHVFKLRYFHGANK